jgi:hypothetical protein
VGTEVKTIHEALIPFALVGAEMDESTNFSFTFRDVQGQNFAVLTKEHFVDAFVAYSATFDNRFAAPPPKVETPVIEIKPNNDIIHRYKAIALLSMASTALAISALIIEKLGG